MLLMALRVEGRLAPAWDRGESRGRGAVQGAFWGREPASSTLAQQYGTGQTRRNRWKPIYAPNSIPGLV